MEWGGICGSDLAYWRHGSLRHRRAAAARWCSGTRSPGRIAAVGAGVTGYEVGQPVTVHPAELVGDGCLPERIAGRTNLYPRIRYFGSAAFDPHTDGGFSELRVVRADQIRPLPDGVSTEHGALAEPLAVALHAVHRAGDVRGRDVVVNGAGPDRLAGRGRGQVPRRGHRRRRRHRRRLARGRQGHGRRRGPQPGRRATPCPRTPSWCSRRRAPRPRWASVLRATARGGTLVQVGNLPGTAGVGGARRPGHPGDHLGRARTGSSRRSATRSRPCATASTCRPLITHRFDRSSEAEEALAVAADRTSGQQQGHAAAREARR